MSKAYSNQKEAYNEEYKKNQYLQGLPDYKISDGRLLRGKKILVLGVGTGRDIAYLARKNEIVGLDISSEATVVANKFGIKAKVVDLEKKLQFKNQEFDIVVAKDILEHLINPKQLLEEINRVLKGDGYAVVSVPNHYYYGMRLRLLLGKGIIWKSIGHDHGQLFNEWNYMHKIFFTWKGFKEFLYEGNFTIKKTFWDFGTLAHYAQPEMVIAYLNNKNTNERIVLTLSTLWNFFNFIFPRSIRGKVVSLSPNLLCAGFYVWCSPSKRQDA